MNVPTTNLRRTSGLSYSGPNGPSSGGNGSSTGVSPLQVIYDPIQAQMKAVEQRLHRELQTPYESLAPVLRHGTQLGGKRLRPAMLLLVAEAVGSSGPDHVTLATVIEMVHTATLVHDDVLDEADMRRHVPTINAKWNDHTSILLGDYLFAQSFRLAATLSSTEACRWIGEAARLVCEGELRQVLDRNTIDLDEATYIEMIRGKTAELCRVACQLGARHAGGSDSIVEAMSSFGDRIGIAFQIADDYLDLWGDDDTVGKTLGTDVEQGKITLPLIRLMATASERDSSVIHSILKGPGDRRLDALRPVLSASDALEYTRETALRFQREAVDSLACLPSSQAKDALMAIAYFAVARRF